MILETLLALALAQAATGVPSATPWHVTPVSFCKLAIDLRRQANPHAFLQKHLWPGAVACPFTGNPDEEEVLEARLGHPCRENGTSNGIPIVSSRSLSLHQFDAALATCVPLLKSALSTATSADGIVHLIRVSTLDFANYKKLTSTLNESQIRAGLPISRSYSLNENGAGIFCFEALAGAPTNLLTLLRQTGIDFPARAAEERVAEPNCTAALKGKIVFDWPRSAAITINLETAAGSIPSGGDFAAAVLAVLNSAHLSPNRSADGSYQPLTPDDPRPLILKSLREDSASISLVKLEPRVCDAVFQIMVLTQAFVRPIDDQSPTMILSGTTGGQPARYTVLALKEVGSGFDICSIVGPALKRQARESLKR